MFISDRSQELVDVQKIFTNLWKLGPCTANKCVDQSQWFISITSWCNLGWSLVPSSLRKPNCVAQFYMGANPSAPSPLGREFRRSSRHVKAFCKYIFPCLLMLFIKYTSSVQSFVKLCNEEVSDSFYCTIKKPHLLIVRIWIPIRPHREMKWWRRRTARRQISSNCCLEEEECVSLGSDDWK